MRKKSCNTCAMLLLYSIAVLFLGSCTVNPVTYNSAPPLVREPLFQYAAFDDQVTGIAVSQDGRLFVSFPRWDREPRYSVAEAMPDGSLRPYPHISWNRQEMSEADPYAHFISVHSIFVDGKNVLWILDSPSPYYNGPFPKGPKLVGVDLVTNRVKKVIPLEERVAPRGSYLRNVCIDKWGIKAYVSDAGTGALIVTDLDSGLSRRLLARHASTKAEPGVTVKSREGGLLDKEGNPAQLQVDGIALDQEGVFLYYHALTAHTLYRIQTRYLNDPALSEEELGKHVERLADTGCADGIFMDRGYNLYLAAPEERAIKRYRVDDGSLVTLVKDDAITWPDSITMAPDDFLYFTVSQFSRLPRFNNGIDKRHPPYKVFRINKFLMPAA